MLEAIEEFGAKNFMIFGVTIIFVIIPVIIAIYYLYRSCMEIQFQNMIRIKERTVEIYDDNERKINSYVQQENEVSTIVNNTTKVYTRWNDQTQKVDVEFEDLTLN